MAQYVDRQTGLLKTEVIYQEKTLSWLYETRMGNLLLRLMVSKPLFSKLYTKQQFKKKSVKDISTFIEENNIDMGDYEEEDWQSFADFFIRKPKKELRPWPLDESILGSPCDAKLLVKKISVDSSFHVKGFHYTVSEFIKDDVLAKAFLGGYCFIFRLSVSDIHRYYYIDDGKMIGTSKKIKGRLHTVGPVSDNRVAVLTENCREVTRLNCKYFSDVLMVEVGALTIGSIVNHERKRFKRGDEKGWFCPGGSTIVLCFKDNLLTVDKDILDASKKGLEINVKIGDAIARLQ